MAGGFRSPLHSLGISASARRAGFTSLAAPWLGGASASSGVKAGYTSLVAPWLGGASASPGAARPGFTSLLAPWMGGASARTTKTCGYVSMLAPWMGGACAIPGVFPPIPTPTSGGGFKLRFRPHDVRKLREDEEILVIITAFLDITNR